MKKLLFISLIFLGLLTGCKGGAGNTPDVPEQFDLNKINFDYKMREGYEGYEGLELYKKISNDKDHYLFYIDNNIYGLSGIKVLYSDEILGTVKLLNYTKYKELTNKYFNLELNVEEPETFKDYTYEFEKLENKIHLIILPAVGIDHNYSIGYEKFIESDDYPLYYSDDEKDIHIGFTFEDNLIKPNCIAGVYNFTDLRNKYNARYCVPVPFCIEEYLSLGSYDSEQSNSERKNLIKDIIGLEYDDFYELDRDYKFVKDILENNEDISTYNKNFYNSSFNEEHYNFIKNHGTTFNISFDKLSFKGIYSESWEDYRYIGLIVNINSVELYELDNEKYVSTPLREKDYPELYKAIKEYNCYTFSNKDDIYIALVDLEISPYENKILGWNYTKYRY